MPMMPCPEGPSRTSRYPEAGPAVAVLGAWVALAVLASRGGELAGMDMGPSQAGAWAAAVAGLPSWLLMTVAMMGPAALPRFRYVGRPAARPALAMAAFGVAYLAVWAVFGLAARAAAAAVPGVPGPRALALVLFAALAWQLSPVKRSLLRGCHARQLPPRSGGTPARAVAQGTRYGLCCLGTCWCLMLVMVAVPAGGLLWMAGLTAAISAERVCGERASAAAAALGVAAVATLAVGGLL